MGYPIQPKKSKFPRNPHPNKIPGIKNSLSPGYKFWGFRKYPRDLKKNSGDKNPQSRGQKFPDLRKSPIPGIKSPIPGLKSSNFKKSPIPGMKIPKFFKIPEILRIFHWGFKILDSRKKSHLKAISGYNRVFVNATIIHQRGFKQRISICPEREIFVATGFKYTD